MPSLPYIGTRDCAMMAVSRLADLMEISPRHFITRLADYGRDRDETGRRLAQLQEDASPCCGLRVHSNSSESSLYSFALLMPWFLFPLTLLIAAILLDTKDSFESMPPELVADYLLSPELIVLNENDQYKFSNLAESREAIKAANIQ